MLKATELMPTRVRAVMLFVRETVRFSVPPCGRLVEETPSTRGRIPRNR